MKYLYVRNWRKFQHYKRRNPPWIKLYCNEILSNPDWVMAPDRTKLLMLCCVMIAQKFDGRIPNHPEVFKKLSQIDGPVDFNPLIDNGFLASKSLADCYQNALPETETETETETEKKVLVVARKRAPKQRGSRLPLDWQPSSDDLSFGDKTLGTTQRTSEEVERFKDYWIALPGNRGLKLDWHRTWRNWCRNSHQKNNGGSRSPTPRERMSNALQQLGSGTFGEVIDLRIPKLPS